MSNLSRQRVTALLAVSLASTGLVVSLASAPGAAAGPPHHRFAVRTVALAGRAPGRAVAATYVHHVSPINKVRKLKRGYRVTAAGRGSCWTSSFLHPELFRCFLGNYIEDPCWPEGRGASVLCLPRPWSRDVTRIRLTKRLPQPSPGRGAIWGLTLLSGNRCQVPGGTHEVWRGHDVNYYCHRRWVLLDAPDRTRRTWHIRTARRVHHHYEGRGLRQLTDAWRPKGP